MEQKFQRTAVEMSGPGIPLSLCVALILCIADLLNQAREGEQRMSTAVTQGIRITARPRYEAAQSDPRAGRYFFSYRITITNRSNDTVRLQRRHWIIRDSLAAMREVEGPGVVGETPVLEPGEEYTYSSACDLRSGFGRMEGTYLMERLKDGHLFSVTIPEFQLSFPLAAN